ncbi:MAG: acyl carrier protein [Chloroflexota bacterium]
MSDNKLDIIGVSRLDDKRAPEGSKPETGAPGQPVGATEAKVMELWREALPGVPIQREDNFIAIGGDSLSLAQVIMQIEKQFNVTLAVEAIANNLTLAGMAAVVDELTSKNASAA